MVAGQEGAALPDAGGRRAGEAELTRDRPGSSSWISPQALPINPKVYTDVDLTARPSPKAGHSAHRR